MTAKGVKPNREKPIRVTLKGKINASFIVLKHEKIKMWKLLSDNNTGALCQVSYKEIKK